MAENSEAMMAEEMKETETSQSTFAGEMDSMETTKISIEADSAETKNNIQVQTEDDRIESEYDWAQNVHEKIEKIVDGIVPTYEHTNVLEGNESKRKVKCKINQSEVRKKNNDLKGVSEMWEDVPICQETKRHEIIYTGDKSYKCKLCKKSFNRLDKLTKHVTLYSKDKSNGCDQCGKMFQLPHHLKTHAIVHTDEVPHTCEECGKTFKYAETLRRHARNHVDDKPFRCETCNKTFTRSDTLKEHVCNVKPFKCKLCEKAFTRLPKLKRHSTVHKGEYPYDDNILQQDKFRPEADIQVKEKQSFPADDGTVVIDDTTELEPNPKTSKHYETSNQIKVEVKSQTGKHDLPSVMQVCNNFQLKDVDLKYEGIEHATLANYKMFHQAFRKRFQDVNPKVPMSKLIMLVAAKWREFNKREELKVLCKEGVEN